MKTMMKVPQEGNVKQMLKVAILTFALTLTACGGGGGGGSSSSATNASPSLIAQINQLIATGKPADLETAMDLLLTNEDTLTAAQFEAIMDAISIG